MSSPQLIPFDILRKTERPDSLVRHGAYKLDAKFLKRIKELVFYEKVVAGEEDNFKFLPSLQQLHLNKGVDQPQTLANILPILPKLRSLVVKNWGANFDTFSLLSSLADLDVEYIGKQKSIELKQTNLRFLKMHLTNSIDALDLSQLIQLENFYISGFIPTEFLCNEKLTGLTVYSSPDNEKLTAITFDGNAFRSAKNIHLFDLYIPLSVEKVTPLPWVKTLNYMPDINFEMIPQFFGGLETLSIHGAGLRDLNTILYGLPSLKNLRIGFPSISEEEIIGIQNNFHKVAMTANLSTGMPFTERFFENGKWEEYVTR
ncbi:hypothetical protein WSM22_00760 [Cytophagales bacterium WSM2-2]|nr:hypothetical protein WSM22_00760 [Cytophagales bacterium WSM2-2]